VCIFKPIIVLHERLDITVNALGGARWGGHRRGRSRKPKPTAQKKLAGNPGKRALNEAEPQFSTVTNIDPPDWLSPRAATMWRMLIPELLHEHVVALTDLHNVEAFCTAYDKWRMAEEAV